MDGRKGKLYVSSPNLKVVLNTSASSP
jgi:hypothetical protein